MELQVWKTENQIQDNLVHQTLVNTAIKPCAFVTKVKDLTKQSHKVQISILFGLATLFTPRKLAHIREYMCEKDKEICRVS